jgi:atrophin-1 interacting protein 1
VKSVIPNGPAAVDGHLQTGDVLVFVDERCVLGTSQEEAMRIFQSIDVGQAVTLRLCRGYALIVDPQNQVDQKLR